MAEWTIKQALICFIGSTIATFALSLGGYWGWQQHKERQLHDERFRLAAIIQTGAEKEALKTAYLAELLDLSQDKPISLYALNCKQAVQKLISSPLISQASVKRIPPGVLYIDYEMRKPVAHLADYKNVAVDRTGHIFPFSPFYSPKEIPEIYLGLPSFGASEDRMGRRGASWTLPLNNRFFQLALEVLQFLETAPWREGFRVKRIDVSNAFAPSLGQREIVILTEEQLILRSNPGKEIICTFQKILRLAPKDFIQQLSNFFSLRRNIEEDYRKQLANLSESSSFAPRIIDLRIPQLAFVQK